jgi:hypothetical protein
MASAALGDDCSCLFIGQVVQIEGSARSPNIFLDGTLGLEV